MATKLILVRHGETDWNKESRFQGNQDIALNKKGEAQAQKLADRLADEKIDLIYSSNLGRAHTTAKIIAQEHNLEVGVRANLQEIDFGVWEGLTFAEINEQYSKEFSAWKDNPNEMKPKDGESLKEVEKRAVKAMNELLEEHDGKTILVAAHGGVNRVVISNFLGMPLDKCWRLNQDNTAVNIINISQTEVVLEKFNSTCHLSFK